MQYETYTQTNIVSEFFTKYIFIYKNSDDCDHLKFLGVPKNFVYQEITFPKLFNVSNYTITPLLKKNDLNFKIKSIEISFILTQLNLVKY
jgi:hypothetical protein